MKINAACEPKGPAELAFSDGGISDGDHNLTPMASDGGPSPFTQNYESIARNQARLDGLASKDLDRDKGGYHDSEEYYDEEDEDGDIPGENE